VSPQITRGGEEGVEVLVQECGLDFNQIPMKDIPLFRKVQCEDIVEDVRFLI